MKKESNTRQRKSRLQANLKVLDHNKESQREYRFKIEFLIYQEDGTYIAYCPALDISSSGESFNEAVGNFYEMFQLHIECCIENNTLHDDLLAHGWVLEKEDVLPPQFSSLVGKKEVKRLLNESDTCIHRSKLSAHHRYRKRGISQLIGK